MPEFPDVQVYCDRLQHLAQGQTLGGLTLVSPFVLRSIEPQPAAFAGRKLMSVTRLAKRIALGFEGDLYAVIHLMILGRLQWRPPGAKTHRKQTLAVFAFETGELHFVEHGSKKRASLHLAEGRNNRDHFHPGGIDPLQCGADVFMKTLRAQKHTLKRALTDQHLIAGIGNAYSDEILFAAGLSPFRMTTALSDEEAERLYDATVNTLTVWYQRLSEEALASRSGFPRKVTAFRPEMAVHGRYKQPCLICGKPVQRIQYADNESNDCAVCQTGGRIYADRSLSKLLKDNWPKTMDELEGSAG